MGKKIAIIGGGGCRFAASTPHTEGPAGVELAGAPAEMNKFVLPRDATLGVILLPTRIQVEMTPDNL